MSDRDNKLGRFIKSRREELGMNQEQLAELIGADRAYLSQIETGRKGWPRKYIPALAGALNVSEAVLRNCAGRGTASVAVLTNSSTRQEWGWGPGRVMMLSEIIETLYREGQMSRGAYEELTKNLEGVDAVMEGDDYVGPKADSAQRLATIVGSLTEARQTVHESPLSEELRMQVDDEFRQLQAILENRGSLGLSSGRHEIVESLTRIFSLLLLSEQIDPDEAVRQEGNVRAALVGLATVYPEEFKPLLDFWEAAQIREQVERKATDHE